MIQNLFITGDSFSYLTPDDTQDRIWSVALAKKLNYNLINQSDYGVSQDWSWSVINDWQSKITRDDQLVIVLTDPARFWFFKDLPKLSNSFIINFENIINNPDRVKAAEYYIRYIQRAELDIQFLAHRLGWLNNLVRIKEWKKPIIILGFEQFIPNLDNYPDLSISKGNLATVSKNEEFNKTSNRGVDVRYNHLTLRNHDILVNKLFKSIVTGHELDLTTEFKSQFFDNLFLDNFQEELSPEYIKTYLSMSSEITPSWHKRLK